MRRYDDYRACIHPFHYRGSYWLTTFPKHLNVTLLFLFVAGVSYVTAVYWIREWLRPDLAWNDYGVVALATFAFALICSGMSVIWVAVSNGLFESLMESMGYDT